MGPFHLLLNEVCKRPAMYVGHRDFYQVATFLRGYDCALELRPDLKDTGLSGFRDWQAVKLDSCVKSGWEEIIPREDTGADKFRALRQLFAVFALDREARGLRAIRAEFEQLEHTVRKRDCWCELPPEERETWQPRQKRP
jgi:hypothetical protein